MIPRGLWCLKHDTSIHCSSGRCMSSWILSAQASSRTVVIRVNGTELKDCVYIGGQVKSHGYYQRPSASAQDGKLPWNAHLMSVVVVLLLLFFFFQHFTISVFCGGSASLNIPSDLYSEPDQSFTNKQTKISAIYKNDTAQPITARYSTTNKSQ